jgi:hypothetical protein
MRASGSPRPRLIALAGSAIVLGALAIIWASRMTVVRDAYVSELGAEGEPTAPWFRLALLMVVVGGAAIAWEGRGIRSSATAIGLWTPSISLFVGCGFFLVASQVTCTSGCPLPVGDTFTWQDFAHTVAAVLAFAAACLAMLQAAFAVGHPVLSRLSFLIGAVVAVLAAIGGLLSLAETGTGVGSVLELVATTLAIGWLAVFGVAVAVDLGGDGMDVRLAGQASDRAIEPDRNLSSPAQEVRESRSST